MNNTTYSFLDLSGAIAHPGVGAYTFTGEGIGSVVVAMATDKTVHDVAADGSVMISKIAGNNGSISVSCQQTSNIHKWLMAWYNYLMIADTDEWAQMSILLRNTSDGTSHIASGVSPSKVPDKSYQAKGQMVQWLLMAADIQSVNA